MNITKEQIKEWVCKSIYPMATEDGELSEIINSCFNDLAPKRVSVEGNPPPHKEWVLFKVKYKDWVPVIRSGYAKHYENGEVLIVIPEFGKKSERHVVEWMPIPK